MFSKCPLELIINKLKYEETIILLNVNKYLNNLKSIVRYRQLINYDDIKHLSYSDNFYNLKYVTG